MLQITDDSGFLALVVPSAYESFVGSEWTLEQILSHFNAQMEQRSLLIWCTGMEGLWNVEVRLTKSDVGGFREVSGLLEVRGGSLLLTNYESLTMAAQFEQVSLPEEHQRDLLLPLPDGAYTCRIIQMIDPTQEEPAGDGRPHFVVELSMASGPRAVWEKIPWSA